VSLNLLLQLQLLIPLLIMAAFAIARRLTGQLNAIRRVVFDNFALLSAYTIAQMLFGLILVHGFPRALS
jgi:cytochrome c oxidase subunit I+III